MPQHPGEHECDLIKTRLILLEKTCATQPRYFEELNGLLSSCANVVISWVGLLDEKTREVIPVVVAGPYQDYLRKIKVFADQSPYGFGPTGLAIKHNRSSYMVDLEGDPNYGPWREIARSFGFKASCAIPLVQRGKVVGALTFYTNLPDFFDADRKRFVEELAVLLADGMKQFS